MKKNIIANFVGRFWAVFISIITIPFYIKYLGAEAYGLISFFLVLISTVSLLEFGLSIAINREIARYAGLKERIDYIRDLSRSLEIIYWIMGLVLAFVLFIISPVIAKHWLSVENISITIVSESIALMGVIIAFQLPISLYTGGLMGLEKQVHLNMFNIFFSTIRSLGAVLILIIFEPSILLFYKWQVGIMFINAIFFSYKFWEYMPKGLKKPKFNKIALKSIWKFSAGMGGSSIVTFLLSNLDKLILSKILILGEFGSFNIASSINNASKLPSSSVFSALFPKFASHYEAGDHEALRILLHKGTQFISLITFPLSAVIVFYSYDVVFVWSHDVSLATSISFILSILVLGSAINASLGILTDMILASGLSIYIFYQNLISVIILVPILIFLARDFGGLGAAISWLILNMGYLIISVPIFIRKTQPGELMYWYLVDFGKPFLISFGLVGLGKFFIPQVEYLPLQIIIIGFVWVVAQFACFQSLPQMRGFIATWRNGAVLK